MMVLRTETLDEPGPATEVAAAGDVARVVHVIDDSAAVCQAIALLLLGEGLSVAIHSSGTAFLEALPSLRPQSIGCIITDIRMPGLDGLALLRRLREQGVCQPVVVMTAHGDIALAVQAMKAGATDFLEKPFEDALLLDIVKSALHLPALVPAGADAVENPADRIALLSTREREVLDLLVTGKPNKVVARMLGISPRTVEAHRARILERLRVRNLADAVRLAMQAGRG
jgi:two-component system response regulator FixJ